LFRIIDLSTEQNQVLKVDLTQDLEDTIQQQEDDKEILRNEIRKLENLNKINLRRTMRLEQDLKKFQHKKVPCTYDRDGANGIKRNKNYIPVHLREEPPVRSSVKYFLSYHNNDF
jgi:hypothetical protein